jgi:hypothetical protein
VRQHDLPQYVSARYVLDVKLVAQLQFFVHIAAVQKTEVFMGTSINPMRKGSLGIITRALLASAVCVAAMTIAHAGEADAKKMLKAMSDYMASEKAISFDFDAGLEVVTKDDQKLALLSSGSVVLNRPDKIRFTRAGGFADIELMSDGKTVTMFGKNTNIYVQADAPGSVDQLVNDLQEKFKRPMPAADLLLTNSYDELMSDVTDVKDLGSGVIGGVECDYMAFRKKDVDFQIWVAQGNKPYPCRYSITSRTVPGSPQYTIHIRDWKTGGEVASADFTFKNASNANKVEVKDVREKFSDLPSNFTIGTIGAAK